jgi:hypothetical protein
LTEELGQALGHRREGVLRIRAAIGASQVREHHHPGAGVNELIERRNRRADAPIVADHTVLQRNVQVATDQDAFAGERTERVNRT